MIISTFSSLVSLPIDIASVTVGLKSGAITARIKKYKSIIKQKNENLDEILLIAKKKLNTIVVLIF